MTAGAPGPTLPHRVRRPHRGGGRDAPAVFGPRVSLSGCQPQCEPRPRPESRGRSLLRLPRLPRLPRLLLTILLLALAAAPSLASDYVCPSGYSAGGVLPVSMTAGQTVANAFGPITVVAGNLLDANGTLCCIGTWSTPAAGGRAVCNDPNADASLDNSTASFMVDSSCTAACTEYGPAVGDVCCLSTLTAATLAALLQTYDDGPLPTQAAVAVNGGALADVPYTPVRLCASGAAALSGGLQAVLTLASDSSSGASGAAGYPPPACPSAVGLAAPHTVAALTGLPLGDDNDPAFTDSNDTYVLVILRTSRIKSATVSIKVTDASGAVAVNLPSVALGRSTGVTFTAAARRRLQTADEEDEGEGEYEDGEEGDEGEDDEEQDRRRRLLKTSARASSGSSRSTSFSSSSSSSASKVKAPTTASTATTAKSVSGTTVTSSGTRVTSQGFVQPSTSATLSKNTVYAAAGPTSSSGAVRYWSSMNSPTYGAIAYGRPATASRWYASQPLLLSYGLVGFSSHRRGTCVSTYEDTSARRACKRSPGYLINDALMDGVLIPGDWVMPLKMDVTVSATLDPTVVTNSAWAANFSDFSVSLKPVSQIQFDSAAAAAPQAAGVLAAAAAALASVLLLLA